MKKKALISLFLAGVLLLSGCAAQNTAQTAASAAASAAAGTAAVSTTAAASTTAAGSTTAGSTVSGSAETGTTAAAAEVTAVSANTEVFSDRDFEVGYSEDAVQITLAGSGASCADSAVVIDGGTMTITAGGTYILSGTLDDGMVIVDADKTEKVQLVLDGVTIRSETSAALYIRQADKVFVTMTQGSVNTLSNGGSFEAIDENNIDAVIFSKDDLTLNGSGTLTVESPAGHGIVSKDELTVTSGTYEISAASHGMTAKDGIGLANAAFTIVSGKDGIHADNSDDETAAYVYIQSGSYHITAEGDGISASGDLTVIDGSFELLCGGGSTNGTKSSSDAWGQFQGGFGGMGGRGGMGGHSGKSGQGSIGYYGQSGSTAATSDSSDDSTSIKGLKSGGLLTVNGGDFTIDAADDAVHSNGDLIVNGGSFRIATGDDAFHADDDLTVNDGTIVITGSREGIEGTHVTISGGDITLTASDDGINAMGGKDSSGFSGRDAFGGWGGTSSSGSILIEGGNLYIQASGDGLDANGTLTITGGYTVVCGPTQGDTATLDYDVSGTITGGTFLGTGASGMAQSFSAAEQGVIAVNVGNQSAGSEVTLKDASGNTVFSFTPALSFAVVILSDSSLASGQTYTLTAGSYTGTVTAK